MKVLCRYTFLFTLVVSLISCSGFHSSEQFEMPADEATAEERVKIIETLKHISEIAMNKGYNEKFESIPVLVTSENIAETGRLGYCQWDQDHKGQYIVINRENFERDKQQPYLQTVFSVLLHEVGHCYFGREHDHRLIINSGYIAKVEVSNSVGGSRFFESGFPLSIMYVGSGGLLCSGDCPEGFSAFGSIPEFQDYYVSELIGTQKSLSVEDITKFRSFKWVKSE